jgi:photosystem II stability/assembly factor-like uncharacterized protein
MKNHLLLQIILLLIFLFESVLTQTWIRKNEGFGFWAIEKDNIGNIYAGTTGTPRGIFKSTDGGDTWTNLYLTGTTNYLEISFDSFNNVYVAAGSAGVLKSTDGGTTFTNIPASTFGGNSVNTVLGGSNGLLFVGVTNGGVYRSTDFGNTFSQVLSGYSIVSLEFDKFNSNFVYAGSSSTTINGFFRSTDGGLTFSGPLNSINVWEILQNQDSSLLTLGTSSGYPVQKSTNFGLNWTTIGSTPAAIRGACLDLVGNIYAAGNGGVYKSTNGGVTFSNFNLTFSSNKIISYQNKILVAVSGTTNGGIYIYTDQAIPVELKYFTAEQVSEKVLLKWSTATELNNKGFEIERVNFLNQNLNNEKWNRIAFIDGKGTSTEQQNYFYYDEIIKSGTYKYRLKQIDFDGSFSYSDEILIEVNLPDQFVLYQNYPNPFSVTSSPSTGGNSSTVISWQSPVSGQHTIKLFDVLGREMETLVDGYYEAGKHFILFTINSSLPSGIYFYQFKAVDPSNGSIVYRDTKKMVLMR